MHPGLSLQCDTMAFALPMMQTMKQIFYNLHR